MAIAPEGLFRADSIFEGFFREEAIRAQHLLAQQDCCLDQPFTQKLRRLSPDAEFLLQPDMQEFLEVVFTRLVATSTFVERRFASYGAWVARRSAGCRLATLAAKHVTSCLKEFVSSWKRTPEVALFGRHRRRKASGPQACMFSVRTSSASTKAACRAKLGALQGSQRICAARELPGKLLSAKRKQFTVVGCKKKRAGKSCNRCAGKPGRSPGRSLGHGVSAPAVASGHKDPQGSYGPGFLPGHRVNVEASP